MDPKYELATFAGGCFWCTEEIFRNVRGVEKVTSGYAGGTVEQPTYEEVCAGTTGHAEAVQFEFDPKVISYSELVELFFLTHDPTTKNRQGNDIGTQYRSVIFFRSDEQKSAAEKVKTKLEGSQVYSNPIVTEITPFISFFAAEDYHQNYYHKNPDQAYCKVVIDPKVAKFRKKFAHLLKSNI